VHHFRHLGLDSTECTRSGVRGLRVKGGVHHFRHLGLDSTASFVFRFYGEAVVEACVEDGAHHLDISG
jgi:hypothetical protein